MFFDDLLGRKVDPKSDIKANITNLFNQRCSCSLDDYFSLIEKKGVSVYKYYGVVDFAYLTESNTHVYARHLEQAVRIFETRIRSTLVDVQTHGIVVDIAVSYETYTGEQGTINMKLTRR